MGRLEFGEPYDDSRLDPVVEELQIIADRLETLLSEQKERYDEYMANTKLN